MATAIEIYLIQTNLQRKISFEIALPEVKPMLFESQSTMEKKATLINIIDKIAIMKDNIVIRHRVVDLYSGCQKIRQGLPKEKAIDTVMGNQLCFCAAAFKE